MTSEKQFEEWQKQFNDEERSRLSWVEYLVAKEAWLEATRQTYEDAMRICELGKSVPLPDGVSEVQKQFVKMAVDTSAFLADQIKARLKELTDNQDTGE